MKIILCFCFIALSCFILAHEGHQGKQPLLAESFQEAAPEADQAGRPKTWTQWIGGFHLILLHFPIALINMVAIAELLFFLSRKPLFEYASRFMLIAAAIFAPITALLGLIYSEGAPYQGLMLILLSWHMWFGIATAFFTIVIAFMREQNGTSKLYYLCLFLLFLMINITGYFGGAMTFGPFQMLPPV
jgi:uncharacterized membrane protein